MSEELTRRTFPPGFLWGVSIGAHQSEGNNLASDWWHRENQPDTTVTTRSGDAIDSYHRWPEDLDLAAGAGFTDYRFGVEWARIEPSDGHVSRASVDHCRRIVAGALDRGLRPMLTLHHFTTPLWFAAGGGWTRPDSTERFLRYVDAVAPIIEEGVRHVMTINEPNVLATFPSIVPGTGGLSSGLPVPDAAWTATLIGTHHAAAARLRDRHPGTRVGWGVSVQDYRPAPGAEDATDAYSEPRDQVFLRAAAGDDFIGVQTYTGGTIGVDGQVVPPVHADLTLTGWQYLPDALGGAVRRVARVLPEVPIIVTENGVAIDDDDRRIAFTRTALTSLRAAMDDGVDVRGYLHWSLLDNWEWGTWVPTFGLVAVDRPGFSRRPKPSLRWLGSLAPRQEGTR